MVGDPDQEVTLAGSQNDHRAALAHHLAGEHSDGSVVSGAEAQETAMLAASGHPCEAVEHEADEGEGQCQPPDQFDR